MDVLIVKHIEVEGPGLFGECLKEERIPYQTLTLGTGSNLPPLDNLSHILLLGGPMNVYEEDRHPFLREEDLFIKEAIQRGKPVLGICLGAQLIAKALGAKVFKAPSKEIGWYEVRLTEEGLSDVLFRDFPPIWPVFQWHEDTFSVPRSGRLLATSGLLNQAFRYGENAYALQFHLEVTEEMIRDWVETYDDEFKGSGPPPHTQAEILAETGLKIAACKERGKRFFRNFFRNTGKV